MSFASTTYEIYDTKPQSDIVAFAILGIALTVIAMIAIWLVIGHIFVRFPQDFKNKRTLKILVITCLLLAFINGFVRWVLLTDIFFDTQNILLFSPYSLFQCEPLVWTQIFIAQLNQYLFYIYLLSRIKSLKLLSNGVYYFLLSIVSFAMLFTTIVLPFYNVPIIFESEDETDIILCDARSLKETGIFEEYAVFLSLDAVIYCVLLFVFFYKFNSKACSLLSKRILFLGMIAVTFNLIEFIIFILSERKIHVIRMIVYCLLILLSFDIFTKNQEKGDRNFCCWCTIDDRQKPELVGDDDEDTESPMIMHSDDPMIMHDHSDDPLVLVPNMPNIPNNSTGLLAN